ncbi:MAG: type IV pilus assembly protein PilX [Pseudohongiellaceae bacterium]|jgi:type IV pilus assembly protein PilX
MAMNKMHKYPRSQMPRRQSGAILIFCLVFLSILTVMGTTGMETTVLEERMSSNMRDYTMAFQSAESSLKNAEAWLQLQTSLPIVSGDGSTRVWSEDSMDPAVADGKYWWDHASINSAWWTANGQAVVGLAGVAAQPSYIIEEYRTVDNGESLEFGSTRSRTFHRITAHGVGINPNTAVHVQSTFVQSYN